ncbi:hypothetical protein [Streptosporangium sp. OZ121]|uniref:hypothetical protein n=1 Tax=Streptosporangium sp. OZ121 TaxID=3444183 RepID=UPI003F790FC0
MRQFGDLGVRVDLAVLAQCRLPGRFGELGDGGLVDLGDLPAHGEADGAPGGVQPLHVADQVMRGARAVETDPQLGPEGRGI